MSNVIVRRRTHWLVQTLTDKKVIALFVILGVGLFFRLWNIDHLLNAVHDYDEGVYALDGLFMTQGHLPYRDFILVHPPLYALVLSAIFKVFGYNFFYAKYFSIFISLASVVLMYFTGKKISHPWAGIVAAGLFAISPDMVYIGRRVVQEPLGIFLLLLAIYFIFDFLSNGKKNRLFFSGLAIGLAIATKYIFSPVLIATLVGITLILMGERFWMPVRRLARPSFLLVYFSFYVILNEILLAINGSLHITLPIPFFSLSSVSPQNVALTILTFLVPFLIAVYIMEKDIRTKEWGSALWGVLRKVQVWYLLFGTLAGYFIVTGFFWATAFHEFLSQTLLVQERSNIIFPSATTMLEPLFSLTSSYGKLVYVPIFLCLLIALFLLNKPKITRAEFLLAISMVVSWIACQAFPSSPRYYYSIYPFFLLALVCLIPRDIDLVSINIRNLAPRIKAYLLFIIAICLLFEITSIMLLNHYGGYDIDSSIYSSDESEIYQKTIRYLESASPHKVFAANPIIVALSNRLNSSINIDTFGTLWLKNQSAEQFVNDKIAERVDYVVLDAWVRWWNDPISNQFIQAIHNRSRLIKVIAPDSANRVEIYALNATEGSIFNGTFKKLVQYKKGVEPSGWEMQLSDGNGDNADIIPNTISGKACLDLRVFEDGMPDGDRELTQAGISQSINFPASSIIVDMLSTFNTSITPAAARPTGVYFVSGDHSLIFSYSDAVDRERILTSPDGKTIIVLRNAPIGQWFCDNIDLGYYWSQTGWVQPAEISVDFVSSTHYTSPGTYDFYVSGIYESSQ